MTNRFTITCPKCGKEISSDSVYCEYCGAMVRQKTVPIYNLNNTVNKAEKATPLQLIGSFLIPILGVVLYAMNTDKKPEMAKSCLIAGIVGFVLTLIFNFIVITIAVIAESM